MNDNLENYMHRAHRYRNIDGTGEIYVGFIFLGFVLTGYLQAILPTHSMWRHGFAGTLFMCTVLLSAMAFGHWGVCRTIKKHITWPRTGYVAYGHSGRSLWSIIVAMLVSVIAVICFANLERVARNYHAMSLGRAGWMALNVAAYAFWVFAVSKEHPWKWLVVVFMALGLFGIAFIVPRGDFESRRPEMWFLCLTWLASGGATLYSYIRHTQPPAPESE
jgi:hypothetical protein